MGFRVRQPGPTDKAPRSGKKIRFEISGKGVERSCVWLRAGRRGAVGSPIRALRRPGGFNGAAFADGVASGRPVTPRSNWRGETNGRLRWLWGTHGRFRRRRFAAHQRRTPRASGMPAGLPTPHCDFAASNRTLRAIILAASASGLTSVSALLFAPWRNWPTAPHAASEFAPDAVNAGQPVLQRLRCHGPS